VGGTSSTLGDQRGSIPQNGGPSHPPASVPTCRLLAHMGLMWEKLRRLVEGRRDASSTPPPTDSREHTTAATHRLGSTGFSRLRSSLVGSLGRAERQSICRATPRTSFSRYSTLLLDRSVQPVERRAKQARKWSRRRPRSAGLALRDPWPALLRRESRHIVPMQARARLRRLRPRGPSRRFQP